jgi:hypothetical protein
MVLYDLHFQLLCLAVVGARRMAWMGGSKHTFSAAAAAAIFAKISSLSPRFEIKLHAAQLVES